MKKTYILTAISGVIGFCGGWVAKCFHLRKQGCRKPKITSHTETIDENNNLNVNVQFSTGDNIDITAKYEQVPANDIPEAEYEVNSIPEEYNTLNYHHTDDSSENHFSACRPNHKKIMIINEDDFEEADGYSRRTFTFYAGNGTLADEDDNPIKNWRELVGVDALNKLEIFGEHSVYVKNDIRGEKYEILLNPDDFEGVDGD